ncbi:MAG: zinc-binding dehydrogenase [Acidobacteria bacterium]|nr:zinc-binding dehydrogenase [Acidobacteriota bacterium]
MRALVITRAGGPEVVEVRDVEEPRPAAGEELIRADSGGLNFADTMAASGGYPGTPKPPLVAGREFSGTRATNGERVMGYTQWGAFAEVVSARSTLLWPVPRGWSAAEGAAFPVNFFTAYFAYWKAGLVSGPAPGESGREAEARDRPRPERARVLIHAAGGGVGTAAVEIGKLLGVEMYGTSSSEEKLERVRELGLEHAINYKQQDYEEAVKELTGGEGVDVVFEMLGGEHVAKSVRCLRDFGRVIVYGAVTGRRADLDPRLLYAKGASVHGLWLTALRDKPALINRAWQQLSAWAAQGHLRPVIGHVLPLERGQDGFRLLVEGKNFGKVVLKI